MSFQFDQVVDRRAIDRINKWTWYPEDVLPMWVADMDFLTPRPIIRAIQTALKHGILGYELAGKVLLETVAARMEKLYSWKISPEMIVPLPGIGAGLSAFVRTASTPGEGVLVQPPIFPPFIQGVSLLERASRQAELVQGMRDGNLYYEMDFGAFEQAVHKWNTKVSVFLLCNPHNPVGRAYTQAELSRIAEICLEQDITICSDEIHSEILLDGARHFPIASLSPEIEKKSVTLIGPGKSFNMSGLFCAFAVIPESGLREKFQTELKRTALEVNNLGLVAARAAYSGECDEWLLALRKYLQANRDLALAFIKSELPDLQATAPEATYLLWLDCNTLIKSGKITGIPAKFFLETGKLALTDGGEFGPGGQGFVRLNFACPRLVLEEGLVRMKKALA
jgi:cystathionine beta-lyase